jgi:rhamnose transport system substrate-binding protein
MMSNEEVRMKGRRVLSLALIVMMALVAVGCQQGPKGNLKVAMVVKNLGNSFFEACRDGGLEAAKELGSVDLIYQGPSTPTAEGQIELITTLIAQKVNAIVISANDVDALVPICKKAAAAGIKVISFDSGVAAEGRILHLAPSGDEFIGRSQVKMASALIGDSGEVAVLSASSQATNQNAWIEWMKKELSENHPNMKLDAVVYGDDLSDKSYREAMGLFKSYPKLKVIIAPTTVGIAAAGKAIEDAKKQGKVQLTGLGLPSEMKQYIKDGTCLKMSLWNPIDLGYSATYIATQLVRKNFKGTAGEVMKVGRMGEIKIGDGMVAVMSEPYVFDKDNIDKFAAIY